MNFPGKIIDTIGSFDCLKLRSILGMNFEVEDKEDADEARPLSATIKFLYHQNWVIVLKFTRVRRVELAAFGKQMMNLGEPFVYKEKDSKGGEYVFFDELAGHKLRSHGLEVIEVYKDDKYGEMGYP